MLLVIDNYDSFTYNLVQYLGELGAEVEVRRNDAITVDEIGTLAPSAIVLSPGPCAPAQAGITVDAIRRWGSTIPILGVCLGHQAIGEAYGGRVVRADRVMHGKTSYVEHDGEGVFAGLPSPMEVMRYHSLIIESDSLPDSLEVVAHAAGDRREVHGVRHREHPVYGVQFHPESVMTQHGKALLQNFLELAR
jgi:anthranilate synthase component 2